uniref:7TM_GPCR_Srx domain-containing protein n=1 Tax=Strongyloides papillosus TaxID=174720 RepID=A0A0N5BT41_STREA
MLFQTDYITNFLTRIILYDIFEFSISSCEVFYHQEGEREKSREKLTNIKGNIHNFHHQNMEVFLSIIFYISNIILYEYFIILINNNGLMRLLSSSAAGWKYEITTSTPLLNRFSNHFHKMMSCGYS